MQWAVFRYRLRDNLAMAFAGSTPILRPKAAANLPVPTPISRPLIP